MIIISVFFESFVTRHVRLVWIKFLSFIVENSHEYGELSAFYAKTTRFCISIDCTQDGFELNESWSQETLLLSIIAKFHTCYLAKYWEGISNLLFLSILAQISDENWRNVVSLIRSFYILEILSWCCGLPNYRQSSHAKNSY